MSNPSYYTEPWNYRGRNVIVPHTADIPWDYRSKLEFRQLVQEALDETPHWKPGSFQIHTLASDIDMDSLVVEVGKLPVHWFKHFGHKARNVQVSPFVMLKYPPMTSELTIELKGSPDNPRLVRAYPGGYTPPLPWQVSSGDAPGGRARCRDFWRENAYVFRQSRIQRRSRQTCAPRWFIV